MDSHLNSDFRKYFLKLPKGAQQAGIDAYKQWKQNPLSPELDFKPIDSKKQIYSVRAGISQGTSYRAFGVRNGDEMIWYWIGTHEKANGLYKNVGKKNTGNL